MIEIIEILKKELFKHNSVDFIIADPDIGSGLYAGEQIYIGDKSYLHHSFRSWVDLAGLLECCMLTPVKHGPHSLSVSFQKLQADSFHNNKKTDSEKYGKNSIFSRINKMEEPAFAWPYRKSLEAVKIASRHSILNLGINSGDEFLAIQNRT